MRTIILLLSVFIYLQSVGQNIKQRIVLFGDAGEINAGQQLSIKKASEIIIPDKSTVYFLGDNIYPYGMALDSINFQESVEILQSQILPFAKQNVPVTFLSGNHDWDKSGKNGLEKIKAQERYIKSLNSSNIQFLPEAGTANIITKTISSNLEIILFDSEYWLFPNHSNPDSALSTEIRRSFLNKIAAELAHNKDKHVLILSHHPMRSYGEHGKNITWKDHIFPLTRKWKNLYIPLPVLGSIYPLLRTTVFNSAEDARHPIYKKFIADITAITNSYKNVIFIAGHDHGLQFIQENDFTQIITGAGSKSSFIAHNSSQKFVSNQQGFCVLDCMDNGNLLVSFYTVTADTSNKSFEFLIPSIK